MYWNFWFPRKSLTSGGTTSFQHYISSNIVWRIFQLENKLRSWITYDLILVANQRVQIGNNSRTPNTAGTVHNYNSLGKISILNSTSHFQYSKSSNSRQICPKYSSRYSKSHCSRLLCISKWPKWLQKSCYSEEFHKKITLFEEFF